MSDPEVFNAGQLGYLLAELARSGQPPPPAEDPGQQYLEAALFCALTNSTSETYDLRTGMIDRDRSMGRGSALAGRRCLHLVSSEVPWAVNELLPSLDRNGALHGAPQVRSHWVDDQRLRLTTLGLGGNVMMAASPGEWLEAETARAATTITCHGNCGAACPWAVDTASARLDPETGLQTGPFELRHSLAHRATSAPAEEVQPPGPLVTGTTAFLSQTLRWLLSRWHHGDLRHHARCGSADAPSAPPRAVPAAYFRPVQGPIAAHPSAWEPLYGGFALQLADLVAEHLVRPGDAFTDLRDIAVQLTRADPVIKDADLTKLAVQTMHHTAQRHGLLRYRPRRPDDPGKRIEGRTRIWAVSEAAPDLVHQIRGELSSLRPE